MAGDIVRLYKVKYLVEDKASATLEKIRAAWVGVSIEADEAGTHVASFAAALNQLRSGLPVVNNLDGGLRRVATSSRGASAGVDDLRLAVGSLGNTKPAVDGLGVSIKAAQRSSYGWAKNLEEANLALASLTATGAGLTALQAPMGGLGSVTGSTSKSAKSLAGSVTKMVAGLAGWSVATQAAHAFGDAMREARESASKSAESVLKIRDGLRELANLQGKGSVDDAVVRSTIRLRQASGFTDHEAREFQEQFRGSLPLAVGKGNITDEVAEEVARGTARLAARVHLDPKTAGDLAGSIGAFGPVASSQQGIGQIQQIVDQLNDGRGNLTPLVRELMKGGFSTVGPGLAFRTPAERAAGLSVTTGIVGSAGQSSTALGAAIRGLSGFDKKQGEALAAAGIKSGQDLPEMLRRIKPLIDRAEARGESPSAALASAGFGNKLDRDSIVGLVKNLQVLEDRIAKVRETDAGGKKAIAAGARAEALNKQFFQNDREASNRIADANTTAADVQRGMESEDLLIARKNARAQLVAEKKLDTPGSNFDLKMRNLIQLSAISGADAEQDLIDSRVRENQAKEANRLGIKLDRPGGIQWGTQGDAAQEELRRNASKIRDAQGNPLGGAPTEKAEIVGPPREGMGATADVGGKLDALVALMQTNNELLESRRGLTGGGREVFSWRS